MKAATTSGVHGVEQTQDIGPKVQSKKRSQVTLPLSPKSVQTRTAATFSARKEH